MKWSLSITRDEQVKWDHRQQQKPKLSCSQSTDQSVLDFAKWQDLNRPMDSFPSVDRSSGKSSLVGFCCWPIPIAIDPSGRMNIRNYVPGPVYTEYLSRACLQFRRGCNFRSRILSEFYTDDFIFADRGFPVDLDAHKTRNKSETFQNATWSGRFLLTFESDAHGCRCVSKNKCLPNISLLCHPLCRSLPEESDRQINVLFKTNDNKEVKQENKRSERREPAWSVLQVGRGGGWGVDVWIVRNSRTISVHLLNRPACDCLSYFSIQY